MRGRQHCAGTCSSRKPTVQTQTYAIPLLVRNALAEYERYSAVSMLQTHISKRSSRRCNFQGSDWSNGDLFRWMPKGGSIQGPFPPKAVSHCDMMEGGVCLPTYLPTYLTPMDCLYECLFISRTMQVQQHLLLCVCVCVNVHIASHEFFYRVCASPA